MPPKVKLVYFDVQGRAEVTRMLLKIGKVAYEEQNVEFLTEWPVMKPKTPFWSLPILYWDGLEIAQSQAITRFVAKKVGLAGNSDAEFAFADEILEHTNDLTPKLAANRWVMNDALRAEKGEAILKDYLPGWLTRAENLLKKRGGIWFSGNGLTFGDITMEVILDWLTAPEERTFLNIDNKEERAKLLDSYPLLKDHFHRVRAVPEIAEWIKKRPQFKGL